MLLRGTGNYIQRLTVVTVGNKLSRRFLQRKQRDFKRYFYLSYGAVSYTHLDVYKRQAPHRGAGS